VDERLTDEEIPREEDDIGEDESEPSGQTAAGKGTYIEKGKVPITHGYWQTCESCGGSGKDPNDSFGGTCTLCLGQKQYFIIPRPVEALGV
jgi:DnaJ-class molecular chaperone